MKDARDVTLTATSAAALARYETALSQFQSYTGDAIATLDAALAEDPDFALAHLAKAFMLVTTSEQRFDPMVREAVDAAARRETQLTARERGLLAAARLLIGGRLPDAGRALDRVLVEHPRDVLALQTAHLMDFYQGDALNLRNRVARVLPAWSASTPGYAYVLGMHAFGLEECNQYADAERTARRALQIEPRDGWAVHAVAHVMEMQGRIHEGIDWLRSREADWAVEGNGFAPHNWWHLALFHVDLGDFDAALDLYDRRIDGPQADMILTLVDMTALLWRLQLEGVDVGDRFERVADRWQEKLPVEGGHYAFNDLHAMMSFAATNRSAPMMQLLTRMHAAAQAGDANAAMTRDVGLPLAQGMVAYTQGRFADAIGFIEPARDGAHRFGGSHAQRDLLTLTMIAAATRDGQMALARHYIAERLVGKPTAWSERLMARTRSAQPARTGDARIAA